MKISVCLFLLSIGLNTLQAWDVIYAPPANEEVVNRIQNHLPVDPIIVEAGCYDGRDTAQLSTLLPSSSIYTFEPIPELFEKSSQNLAGIANIRLFKQALSHRSGRADMYLSNMVDNPGEISQSSSLLQPLEHIQYAPCVEFNSTITVPTTTLDDWAQQQKISSIDFLKLDIQGNELDVMKASPSIFSTVKAVLTEVEFVEAYKGQYQFADILAWMSEQGFELDCLFVNCTWLGAEKGAHTPWFGDALFIRKQQKQEESTQKVLQEVQNLLNSIEIAPKDNS